MKTAFVTFVYPGSAKFFSDFIKSLLEQTDPNFHLVIFNDGCSEADLAIFLNSSLFYKIVPNQAKTIAQNRIKAFKWMQNSDYDAFILGDIDDLFSWNRIEVAKKNLLNHNIIINELKLVTQNGILIKNGLLSSALNGSKEISFEMLKLYNLIGFSHVSFKKEAIRNIENIFINDRTIVADWTIFSYLLLNNQAYFITDSFTEYIWHDNNIALKNRRVFEEYLWLLDVKIIHYTNMSDISSWFRFERDSLIEIKNEILKNKNKKENFMQFMQNNTYNYFPWWSQIPESEVLRSVISI